MRKDWGTSWSGKIVRLLSVFLVFGLLGSVISETAQALGVPILVSITVTPSVDSIGIGQTEQFTATGTYSDLSTKNLTDSVTWTSSTPGMATVSSTGLATGVATGAVVITATDSSAVPGTAALTVTPAVLVSVTVTPPVDSIGIGQTEQFTATGTYSDLSTKNLTDSVTWTSSTPGMATVSSTGLATGVATGAVVITATDSSAVPGTAALTVTPAVLVSVTVTPPVDSIGIGQTEQFTATGTYSDLSTKNLTDSVTWTSSTPGMATVSSTGLATGVATGAVVITATDSSAVPGTAALTVTPAVLVSVTVTPPVDSIGIGQTEQFTATGTYSDLSTKNLTDSVTWTSSTPGMATVSSTGLATGVATGAVVITATDSSAVPGTAALTVTPAVLVSVTVTPPVDSIGIGQTEQFTATGTYSDLSTKNLTDSVTWTSSTPGMATVSSTGLATGVATGAVVITATDSSAVPGTAALTVTPAVLVSVTVTPPVDSIGIGQTEQFTATGTYSDLSTKNLTDSVTWTSSTPGMATVSSTGLATGVATGAVVITATDSSAVPGTAVLTISSDGSTPPPPPPTLTMTPTSGLRRTPVTINGSGFTPGQTVTMTYMSGRKRPKRASTVLCSGIVATNGTFSCSGAIPRRYRAGAVGQKSIAGSAPGGTLVTTLFTLLSPKSLPG